MTAPDHAGAGTAALVLEPGENAPVRLPSIHVRTEAGEVAGFLRETGGVETGDFVPLTFPIRWLALPAIRASILQLIGGAGFLPVHEAQSFTYEKSLRIDADYVVDVEIRSSENPARLILKLAVFTPQGENCARLETILRIVRLTVETQP